MGQAGSTTALHRAAMSNSLGAAKLLMEAGADMDATDGVKTD